MLRPPAAVVRTDHERSSRGLCRGPRWPECTPLVSTFAARPLISFLFSAHQEETPYDGGLFEIDIVFPPEYPFKAPQVCFLAQRHKYLFVAAHNILYSPALVAAPARPLLQVKFETRIYHPNVKTDSGEICADLIQNVGSAVAKNQICCSSSTRRSPARHRPQCAQHPIKHLLT